MAKGSATTHSYFQKCKIRLPINFCGQLFGAANSVFHTGKPLSFRQQNYSNFICPLSFMALLFLTRISIFKVCFFFFFFEPSSVDSHGETDSDKQTVLLLTVTTLFFCDTSSLLSLTHVAAERFRQLFLFLGEGRDN